jgi:hypothetical protein
MKSIFFVVLMASAALAQTQAMHGKPVRNISLTEPGAIADAAKVNADIDGLLKDAASCPSANSNERRACVCSFKKDMEKLRSSYAAAIAKHPAWNEEDTVVSWRNPANEQTVALSLPGIKRQLRACGYQQQ